MTIVLRDYQTRVLEQARGEMLRGKRRIIIQAATGAGKGRIIGELARCAALRHTKTLVIADRRKLVTQIASNLDDVNVPYGVIMSGETRKTNLDVIVASRDTLRSWMDNPALTPPDASLIIIDECRKSMGELYQYILARYPKAYVVGFDATPCRNDGVAMEDFWESIVCAEKTSVLIKRGFLLKPVVFEAPELAAKRERGEKVLGLAGDPVANWRVRADGMPTIAACRSKKESQELCLRFIADGIAAECVDSDSPDDEREAVYARLKQGVTKVVCSVKLLIDGVDIPEVSCCIIWCPMGSLTDLLQFAGRAMRPFPGKDRVVILDHSGACGFHKVEPGDDIEWSLDPTKTVRERIEADLDRNPEKKKVTCPACGHMFPAAPRCPQCDRVMGKAAKTVRAGAASEGYEAADEVLVPRSKPASPVDPAQKRLQSAWNKALRSAAWKNGRADMALQMFKRATGKLPWEANVGPLPASDNWKVAAAELLRKMKA